MSNFINNFGCYIEDSETINMIEESSTKIVDEILEGIRCQFEHKLKK